MEATMTNNQRVPGTTRRIGWAFAILVIALMIIWNVMFFWGIVHIVVAISYITMMGIWLLPNFLLAYMLYKGLMSHV